MEKSPEGQVPAILVYSAQLKRFWPQNKVKGKPQHLTLFSDLHSCDTAHTHTHSHTRMSTYTETHTHTPHTHTINKIQSKC